KEILSRFGGIEGLAEYVCEKSGFAEVPVSMAQRGDVVLIKDMLGICLGRRVAAPGKEGVVYLPRQFDRAWRVYCLLRFPLSSLGLVRLVALLRFSFSLSRSLSPSQFRFFCPVLPVYYRRNRRPRTS